jgi:mannose-6-phosphate isomerase-like protein (cupin superfamily)
MAAIGTAALLGLSGAPTHAQQFGGVPAIPAPKDKAAYYNAGDLKKIWSELEARDVTTRRILEGGAYSVNVRIVSKTSPPLVHHQSVDIWVVQEGSATSITGGELLDGKQRRPEVDDIAGSSIKGGHEQALKPGDVLYVPVGVPHGFKDLKGFRALLIRFDTK